MLARTAALLLGAAVSVGATPWHNLGPRAMAMGGAHTAVAQGPSAAYWNPAGLGQLFDISGVDVVSGIRAEATGAALLGANDLNQLAKDCQISACDPLRIKKALDRMDHQGNGAFFDASFAVGARVARGMLFVHSLSYAGGTPEVDHANDTPATIANNSSKLRLRGGNFTHIGYGMGRELGRSGFVVGANAKLIVGSIGYGEMLVVNEDPGAGSFWRYDRNAKTSFQPGLDLGAFWDVRESFPTVPGRPRLGIVGRNVNNPTFTQPQAAIRAGDRNRYSLQSQVRAGIAIQPFQYWLLAADIDITNNETPVDRFRARYAGAGMELRVFHNEGFSMPWRLGLQKNIANDDSALAYTGGTALEFSQFKFELAFQITPETTEFQSERETKRVPNNAAGSVRLAWEFGKADESVGLPY
ncbi:MAG: hypothetical protein AUJ52_06805 [Elusimicrobia bacterium CG1_02_63_36]|nr:MAG: hypothetical protein AUJ52_06805 [Elusimicrobia bacterium CG1_02_63_36]PIP82376.1 MAG: hypothetical protein COR54_15195 [Elusimicrobia bacterium CG22_combo_CG10-13_8_21_14_all_63_91]PJA16485.1 MAG: hypothetical protein COX66_07320 [Elusimicrobia bacterium CG_4_10_14_0_2_um_filter_63_34]PJB23144.1 MAG: hypothetical protein CO113_18885 [Elusimicrobia bacterium CG_4_9_14_3_um_filter_62_55]